MKQALKTGTSLRLAVIASGSIAMLNPLLPILGVHLPSILASILFFMRFLIFFGPLALVLGYALELLACKHNFTKIQVVTASAIVAACFIITCFILTGSLSYSAYRLLGFQLTWAEIVSELLQELGLSHSIDDQKAYFDISFIILFSVIGFALGCVNLWLVVISCVMTRFALHRKRLVADR